VLSALAEGYRVRVVADACGGLTQDSHWAALQRMQQAGAVLTSWLQVLLEFQRDWTRRETYEAARAIVVEHAGGYGIGLDYARDMIKPAEGTREWVVSVQILTERMRTLGSGRIRPTTMSISIRNRLPGTIEKIVSDKVVSEVVIRTAAGIVTSIITTGSVERMNLKEGDNVFAVTKATSVSVEKG
jgi:molybdopterin-binding protein